MSLTLRTISREQHLAYIQSLPSASHMQVPAWADVKAEWRSENLGWFDDSDGTQRRRFPGADGDPVSHREVDAWMPSDSTRWRGPIPISNRSRSKARGTPPISERLAYPIASPSS